MCMNIYNILIYDIYGLLGRHFDFESRNINISTYKFMYDWVLISTLATNCCVVDIDINLGIHHIGPSLTTYDNHVASFSSNQLPLRRTKRESMSQ